jgi:ATP-dependent protease ClpP protease subunit
MNATVIGEACSAAAVILQCAHIRRMTRKATLHYHYGSWRISFMVYFDEKLARLNRQQAIEYQEALILPITTRTGMSNSDVHKLLREDRRLSAQEALERGLIDEII